MHRLVVPTDFSPFAERARRFAASLARATGADVHLLHVESPADPVPEAGADAPREALRREAAEAGGATGALRTSFAVAPAVLTYADEVDADAIVVGTHGRRGIRRLMLGSVAEELVRTSPVDVVVVPGGWDAPAPARRVLVPVDLRAGTLDLLRLGGAVAQATGAERLDLLHVLEPLPYPIGWLDEAVLDVVPTIRLRAAETLRERAGEAEIEPSGVYVERGDPASVIARSAEALDSDLVVLAPHAQSRVQRALLGSVAGAVARSCDRPVLVARSLAGAAPTVSEAEAAAAS